MFGGVFLHVGIEQVKGNSSHNDTPYLDLDRVATNEHLNHYMTPTFIPHEMDRKSRKIVFGIGLLLPTVDIQVLLKITFMLKEANANHRKIQVAG